jgi:hypothetical protein
MVESVYGARPDKAADVLIEFEVPGEDLGGFALHMY